MHTDRWCLCLHDTKIFVLTTMSWNNRIEPDWFYMFPWLHCLAQSQAGILEWQGEPGFGSRQSWTGILVLFPVSPVICVLIWKMKSVTRWVPFSLACVRVNVRVKRVYETICWILSQGYFCFLFTLVTMSKYFLPSTWHRAECRHHLFNKRLLSNCCVLGPV